MAAKAKYEATLADGRVVTRQTHRTYTHVVAVRRDDGKGWGAWAWSGRFDLATKEAARARKVYTEVALVEVRER